MGSPISYETLRGPTWLPINQPPPVLSPPFLWTIHWHTTKSSGWIVQHMKLEGATGSDPFRVLADYWETWRITGRDSIDPQDRPFDTWTMEFDVGTGTAAWKKTGHAYWVQSLPDTFSRGRHPGAGPLAWCGSVANIQSYGTLWITRIAAGQVNVQSVGPSSVGHPNHIRTNLTEIRH